MAKKTKQYLVTFNSEATGEITYPIEATSKEKAAEEFSRQFIGRRDQTLAKLVKVKIQPETEEEE